MPPHLARTWAALDERELVRSLYAREVNERGGGGGYGGHAPELVFYSTRVAQAAENRDANRYSNVLPYDRTLVGSGEGEYVNASVVVADGMWWVAAQVSVVRDGGGGEEWRVMVSDGGEEMDSGGEPSRGRVCEGARYSIERVAEE